ncbi:MAG: hypothetical protein PCFJNLEI_03741 [Verrucomicrobiae bacterium]|nr:hypothetical protein [Verrucomicrobiae bacterium]
MTQRINVTDFNLAATLECGQAFRWSRDADGWYTGVVWNEVWRLRQDGNNLEWQCSRGPARGQPNPLPEPRADSRLHDYLTLDLSLPAIVASFPQDAALQQAVEAHWGLRVLRQEPWETLASFIASSTKQIVQIRQIVAHLAERLGENGAFPAVERVARAELPALAACKLGFRAKYLLAAARMVESGAVRLAELPAMEYGRALEELLKIPGVGEKIANCTLLFSCGHHEAFPIDVHVQRSLKRLFPRRKLTPPKIRAHFGPYAGWAQQYLFYAERIRARPA